MVHQIFFCIIHSFSKRISAKVTRVKPTEPTPERGDVGVTAAGPEDLPSDREGRSPVTQFVVSDHELLRRIGTGAYGDVWLARNILGELRAVKMIHRSRFNDERPFEREFEGIQRFEPISRSHPSQLAVLHVGKNDAAGLFYYVMELADDAAKPQYEDRRLKIEDSKAPERATHHSPSSTLDAQNYTPRTLRHDLEQHGRLPVSDCVQIGLSLTTALAHLHQHGLVHRDIKPSNVIFVKGVPKLGDIGLVTEAGDTQSIVGTEGYLPPEGPGTRQADIYSLGKVLYEISTGMDRRRFAELPEDLRSWSDRNAVVEFNEIVLKACAKDPDRRYQSAEEMHAELALLQRGESVKAKRATQRWFAVAKKVAVAAALLAIFLVGIWFLSNQLSHRSAFQVKWHLTSAQKREVERLFEEGRSLISRQTKEDYAQGVNLLNQATAINPDYAPAYVTLAAAYTLMCDWRLPPNVAMTEAKRNAMKAAEIDDKLADVHFWLLLIKLWYDWDWPGAEKECQRIRKLDPAASHRSYALYLQATGRLADARKELTQAHELGPLSFYLLCDLVDQSLYEHDYDRAVNFGRKMVEMYTNHVASYQWLAKACVEAGRHVEAIAAVQTARRIDDGVDLVAEHGYILARMGRRDEALKLIRYLDNLSGQTYVSPWYKAQIHAGLGENVRAMDYLEKAYGERCSLLVRFRFTPVFDALRSNPRFIALYKQMGLVE